MFLPEAGMTITPEQIIVEIPLDALCLILEMNHLEMPIFRRQKGLIFQSNRDRFIPTGKYVSQNPVPHIEIEVIMMSVF
jgi:hypothetical protein